MNGCTVARLLGGPCEGPVIEAAVFNGEPITACGAHSDLVGPLLDELERRRQPKRCGHLHRSGEARAICERRCARAVSRR